MMDDDINVHRSVRHYHDKQMAEMDEHANQVLFAMIDMDGSISRRYVIEETPAYDDGAGKSRFCNEYNAVYNSPLRTMYPITTLTISDTVVGEVHVSMNDIEHHGM